MTYSTNIHPTLGPTIKQGIMLALSNTLIGMEVGSTPVWQKVHDGELSERDNSYTNEAALDFGIETREENSFPCTSYTLPVFIQFRYRGQRGVSEQDLYLYYLGMLQYQMLQDHELGGLSHDVRELENGHTILGVDEEFPSGFINLEVRYRTAKRNPYKLPGAA